MPRAAALLLLAACAGDPEPNAGTVCGDGEVTDLEECDDGNMLLGDGCSRCQLEPLVTVRWLFYPAVGGEPLTGGCPAGVETVDLVTDVDTVVPYACAERTEGTLFLPPTRRVLARLRDAAGATVAESLPKTAGSWNVRAEFYADGGWVRAWFPRTCLAKDVSIALVPVGGGPAIVQSIPCPFENLASIVSGVAKAGLYDVTLTSNDVASTITGVTVMPNNGVTDLEFR